MGYVGPRCGCGGQPLLTWASEQDCQQDRDWNRWCSRCDGLGALPPRMQAA